MERVDRTRQRRLEQIFDQWRQLIEQAPPETPRVGDGVAQAGSGGKRPDLSTQLDLFAALAEQEDVSFDNRQAWRSLNESLVDGHASLQDTAEALARYMGVRNPSWAAQVNPIAAQVAQRQENELGRTRIEKKPAGTRGRQLGSMLNPASSATGTSKTARADQLPPSALPYRAHAQATTTAAITVD